MCVCLYIYVRVFLLLGEIKYYLSVFVKKRKTERLEFCEIEGERERDKRKRIKKREFLFIEERN